MEPQSASTHYILHNGELRRSDDPVLSISDGAIVSGSAVFETLAAYEGKPFALEEHLLRLRKGAQTFGFTLPNFETLSSALSTILDANSFTTGKARLRITVTAGTPAGEMQWFVEASSPPPHPDAARLITVPFARNELSALSGLKTINYGENAVAMNLARKAGATEALFGNTRGNLCEGTWSNVFVCIDGSWITPPLSSGCLPGITRAAVLQIASVTGSPIEESDLAMADLKKAEAAFLTSSLREIQPVSVIDSRCLASESHDDISYWKQSFRDHVASKLA